MDKAERRLNHETHERHERGRRLRECVFISCHSCVSWFSKKGIRKAPHHAPSPCVLCVPWALVWRSGGRSAFVCFVVSKVTLSRLVLGAFELRGEVLAEFREVLHCPEGDELTRQIPDGGAFELIRHDR
jgi:hypothetical protein